MKKITELAVNIPEYLDRSLKLKQRPLVFKYFLDLLEQKVDNLLREVDERHIFWVFSLVIDYFIIEVVDDDIHDEFHLINHVSFGDLLDSLLELLTPDFLDVDGLSCVLLWLQVPIEKHGQLLSV